MLVKKIGVWLLFSLTLILAASLSASGQLKELGPPRLPEIGTPGGELNIPIFAKPNTLNPITSVLDELDILLHAHLLEFNPVTGELEPALAASYEISEDGKTLTFVLREGLHWSDGHPFSVEDVNFTYRDLVFNPSIPAVNRELLLIDGQLPEVIVQDQRTFSLKFPRPDWTALTVIATQVIVPKHLLQNEASPESFPNAWSLETLPEQIAGMGPFQLVEFIPGERVILKRNEFYWKVDPTGQRLPYVDRVNAWFNADREAALQRLLTSQIDFLVPSQQGLTNLLQQGNAQVKMMLAGANLQFNLLAFNLDSGDEDLRRIFRSPIFRQAISHAINRQKIVKEIQEGPAVERFNPVHPDSPFVIDGVPQFAFDLNQAQEKLRELGLLDTDGDSLLNLTANKQFRFKLLVNFESTTRVAIAELLREDLAKLGISVQIELVSFEELQRRLFNPDPLFNLFGPAFEAVVVGFIGTTDPQPLDRLYSIEGPLQFYHFTALEEPFAYERRIDEIFREAVMTFDAQRRKELFAEFQMIVAEQLPVILITSPGFVVVIHRELGNMEAVKAISGDGPIDLIDVLFIK